MNTIVVNKIVTPKSSQSELKTKKVTINLRNLVTLEKAKNFSTVTLSTGKDFKVTDEYKFLCRQIGKQNCIQLIEVNKVVTFPSTTTNLETTKVTINSDTIVTYEETNLNNYPFRPDLAKTGSLISLTTGTDITVTDDL